MDREELTTDMALEFRAGIGALEQRISNWLVTGVDFLDIYHALLALIDEEREAGIDEAEEEVLLDLADRLSGSPGEDF